MSFKDLSLKAKVAILGIAIFLPAMAVHTYYFYTEVKEYAANTAVSGLMNFVDAKQQGVIRFLGQNEKFARQLLTLTQTADKRTVRNYFNAIVKTDRFSRDDHPFKKEIISGQRRIPTFVVYQAIDYVDGTTVVASSDPRREGLKGYQAPDLQHGYSGVYLNESGRPTITFGASQGDKGVYLHADALMLTNIVNGEIGNLEGDMGAYYLAGVGPTFDYYMVNEQNVMITESRTVPAAVLKGKGSAFPWRATREQAGINCNDAGVYLTNAGAVTGCREAMGYYPSKTGNLALGASMPFYDSEWTIVVEQDADELLQPLYRLLARMSVMGALLALFAYLVFLVVVNHYVFRPLSKLLQR